MSKKRDETKPYKQVIIRGPDDNYALQNYNEYSWGERRWGEDVLIIGDGKRNVSFDEIREKLTGKINKCTRIDVASHGAVFASDPKGDHFIGFSNDRDTSTASFFKLLREINQEEPIYIHLWSCYADNADKEFGYLPPDSIAVLHSSKNAESEGNFDKSGTLISTEELHYEEYDHTLDGVKANLNLSLSSSFLVGSTLKFSKSGTIYTVKYVIPEIEDAERGYLDFVYRYFHEFGERSLVLATDDIEKDFANLCQSINHFMQSDEMKKLTTKPDFVRKMQDIRDYHAITHLLEIDNLTNLKKLLESSRGKSLANIEGVSGVQHLQTPIYFAKSAKAVELLVKHGANVNYVNADGNTPLNFALRPKMKYHKPEVIEALLKAGADPNLGKKPPLISALTQNNTKFVETLLKYGANPNLTLDGLTPIHYAETQKAVKLLAEYGVDLNHRDKKGNTPLINALNKNNTDVIEALLKHRADHNLVTKNGLTPINYANSPKAVELLVKHGADVNHRDKKGNTPLINALNKNNTEVVEALLKAGANPNLIIDGFTPIHYVHSPKAVALLAKYGADLNHVNADGDAPLIGCRFDIAEALLKAGANPFIDKIIMEYKGMEANHKAFNIRYQFTDSQPDLLSYLIKCNDNNVVTSMHSILLLRENAPNLYQKLDRTKVKEFLSYSISAYQDKEGEKITNFRKIIKAGDIESLELALSFNPTVTLSDIKMAKTIYKPLPTKIYEAMNKLNEELPQKQEKFEKLFNEELTKLEANPESYTIKDAVAAMRRAFKSDQLDRDALKEKFEEAKKAKAKPWVNRLLSTRSSASGPGSWSRYSTKRDTGGEGRDI